jgi:hypothetical protein
LSEFKTLRERILAGLRFGAARRADGSSQAETPSGKPAGGTGTADETHHSDWPSSIPADLLRRETLKSAIDALKLELKFTLGDFPEEHEWKSWLKGFGDNDQRLIEIVKQRNPQAAKFSERFPSFWRDLRKQVGI